MTDKDKAAAQPRALNVSRDDADCIKEALANMAAASAVSWVDFEAKARSLTAAFSLVNDVRDGHISAEKLKGF